MKICRKCGAEQSDDRRFCVDCGETLDAPVSAEAEAAHAKEMKKRMEKMARDGDFLSLKPLEKVCGIATLAIGLISGVIWCFPRFAGEGRVLFILNFVIGVVLGASALTPKISWELEKLRLSFTVENADNAVPSGFWVFGRKFSIYAGLLIVAAMFGFGLYAVIRLRLI